MPLLYSSSACTFCRLALHYFFSGKFVYLNDVHVLDVETSTWHNVRCVGDVPAPRYGHSASLVGSRYKSFRLGLFLNFLTLLMRIGTGCMFLEAGERTVMCTKICVFWI